MALPKFDDFFYPFLLVLEGKTMTKREIRWKSRTRLTPEGTVVLTL
jgi:hypothetical protein